VSRDRRSHARGWRSAGPGVLCLLIVLPWTSSAGAQDATWISNPAIAAGSSDFNTATNWTPGSVPNGTATFGQSNGTSIGFSSNTQIGGFTFTPAASNYAFSVNFFTLFLEGAGVLVNGGSASFTTENSGHLFFINTTSAGAATIINNGGGVTEFQSRSTAGSATIIDNSGGFTTFGILSTAGNANITNNSGGNITFTSGSTAGNSTISNSGNIQFLNNATAGNANISNNNLLSFTFASKAGSATITNGGSVNFGDNSDAGNARLINLAGGIVDFSLSAGPNNDGKLSAGSIEGAGIFKLSNQLTVGSNNLSTTVSGVLENAGFGGSLVKVGAGTLTLTGNNQYTGLTIVNGGKLEVNGSITNSIEVAIDPAGTLSGTGAANFTDNFGTLMPGSAMNPTGTLTIFNGLSFESGAIYLVQVSGANASKTNVSSGTVFLTGGTVRVAVIGGAEGVKSYDILHAAAGFNGTTFAGVQSLTPGFTETLSYTSTDAFLNLTADLGGGGGLGTNQQSIANTINNVFNSGGTLPPGFFNLFQLSGGSLSNALTQISGETATGAQQTTFNAMTQFMGVMTDPFMGRGGGFNGSSGALGFAEETNAYAASGKSTDAFAMFTKASPSQGWGQQGWGPRWNVWASGFGGSQSTDGNVALGSNNTTSSIAGTAVGADYLLSPNTLVGFALGGGGTNFSVANGGTGRSDLFQAGAYLFHTSGAAYVSAALAYGWQDVTTNRVVTAAGFDQLRTEFKANAFSGRAEGGYRFVVPTWGGGFGLTPYAAAQFVTFDLPAYAEQAIIGLNTFALSYGAHDVTDPRSELGFRADKSWLTTDGLLTLRGRLAWAHDYDPNRAIGATFQALPGASFVVSGAAQASDSVLTTASVETRWRNGWSAAATFEGEFSGVTRSYAGKGVVRYVW